MTDENENNPLSEQQGYAAPEQAAPVAPPQQPSMEQTPPIADPYNNMGYASAPYAPPPGGSPQTYPQYQMPKKKSKLWLWITLGIAIPLLLCGIGFAALTFWVVGETKPAVDATNKFYDAAMNGEDLDEHTCERYLDMDQSFNDDMEKFVDAHGELESYDFKEVETSGDSAEVNGKVTRDGTEYNVTVQLDKDGDTFKVCTIFEN